jgi:flagellar motor switch protein FliN/FliY
MTPEEALVRIGESTGAAVVEALAAYCPDAVTAAAPVVVESDADPVAGAALPAVVADVSYVDGVRGGNHFLMPLPAVRALAAAMAGTEPEAVADEGAELSELELSAAGEVANQMMAAAAGAMGAVLGEAVAIAAPQTRVVTDAADALAAVDAATSVVSVAIEVLGHPCLMVQLVPHAFVVRMTRALDDLDAEFPQSASAEEDASAEAPAPEATLPAEMLGAVGVRVSAELGRVNMTIRRAVNLAPGAVVELDRELEDPIDLYVNGRRFATGRLVTLDGGEWAVTIDTVAFETAPVEGD